MTPKDGTSQRVYLAVGGTAYHSCATKEKARPTGEESTKGKGTERASEKAKTKATVFGLCSPQPVDELEGCNTDAEAAWRDTWDCQENEWRHTGMLGKVSKVKPTKDLV